MWRAAAKGEATVGLRAERMASEKRARERVVEEGPGAAAREAAGLVRVGSDGGTRKVGPRGRQGLGTFLAVELVTYSRFCLIGLESGLAVLPFVSYKVCANHFLG